VGVDHQDFSKNGKYRGWFLDYRPYSLTEASPRRFITMNERATDDEDDQLPIKATPEDLHPMLAGKLPHPTSLTRKGFAR
jgi:hypothetical protein